MKTKEKSKIKQRLKYRYMEMAKIWSKNSYAVRKKVGAIIVKDGQIISDGYNGTPTGFENECEIIEPCSKSECTSLFGDKQCESCPYHVVKTKPYVLHAEANAILKVARSNNSTEGATLFCTLSPCLECAKLIIQAGIIEIYYDEEYSDKSGIELLKRAGIICKKLM
jgi:dCMP deaminase